MLPYRATRTPAVDNAISASVLPLEVTPAVHGATHGADHRAIHERHAWFEALFAEYRQLVCRPPEIDPVRGDPHPTDDATPRAAQSGVITYPAYAEKSDGTVVTDRDRAAHRLLCARLQQTFPTAGILSEEGTAIHQQDAEAWWVIDPIDGTASFVRGYPCWGVGIGLLVADTTPAGYLHFPQTGETLLSTAGTLTYNGRPWLPPTKLPSQERGAEASSLDQADDVRHVLVGSTLHEMLDLTALRGIKLRNFGANLYHLAALALGRAEAMICQPVHLWDLVAGLAFTRPRGMIERYSDGRPLRITEAYADNWQGLTPKPLIIGPPAIVDHILERLQR